ncbi:MAG TPA: hypothetical protein VJ396_09980, partial [Acidiferrobacterales bacterium]|nr:hypothetical protein [Acidiferrobacterales bacterium]
ELTPAILLDPKIAPVAVKIQNRVDLSATHAAGTNDRGIKGNQVLQAVEDTVKIATGIFGAKA